MSDNILDRLIRKQIKQINRIDVAMVEIRKALGEFQDGCEDLTRRQYDAETKEAAEKA